MPDKTADEPAAARAVDEGGAGEQGEELAPAPEAAETPEATAGTDPGVELEAGAPSDPEGEARGSEAGGSEAGGSEAGDSEAGDSEAGDSEAGDSEAGDSEAGDSEAGAGEPGSSRLRWYAVHTYSGHENKARLTLLERIKNAGLDEKFGEVLIPTESVVEMVRGQRRTTTRKFYPGYMFVQMELEDLTFHLVKNTPKITGFLGGNKPVPVKDEEIAGINRQMTEGATKPKPRVSFEDGENIRVIGGPFSNFTGIVEEVRPEKQKVRVLVSIFGRATPVELDFSQVEKT